MTRVMTIVHFMIATLIIAPFTNNLQDPLRNCREALVCHLRKCSFFTEDFVLYMQEKYGHDQGIQKLENFINDYIDGNLRNFKYFAFMAHMIEGQNEAFTIYMETKLPEKLQCLEKSVQKFNKQIEEIKNVMKGKISVEKKKRLRNKLRELENETVNESSGKEKAEAKLAQQIEVFKLKVMENIEEKGYITPDFDDMPAVFNIDEITLRFVVEGHFPFNGNIAKVLTDLDDLKHTFGKEVTYS